MKVVVFFRKILYIINRVKNHVTKTLHNFIKSYKFEQKIKKKKIQHITEKQNYFRNIIDMKLTFFTRELEQYLPCFSKYFWTDIVRNPMKRFIINKLRIAIKNIKTNFKMHIVLR